MSRTVDRYLQRRTAFDDWSLDGPAPRDCRAVVVIPALAEHPGLLDTLRDLARSEVPTSTLAIVVVNNRAPQHAHARDLANNQQTLEALRAWDQVDLPVAWVDAASPGRELPPGQGVGLARKIGLDHGLRLLAEQGRLAAPLISLDADTRIDANYLGALHGFFAAPDRWACVVPYAHPVEGTEAEQAAIVCYELYLRYHALHLRWAGSPYGFHTIGSALACTAEAYAAVSGMNRRQAGEDFYFLQQLAKTGPVERLTGTVVRPSARASRRAPFGTGQWVQRYLDGEVTEYPLLHPDSYAVLRRWLGEASADPSRPGAELQSAADGIHGELGAFLRGQGFTKAWDRIVAQRSTPEALAAQFHRWFDGLRTLRLLHHLRDSGLADVDMSHGLRVLLERLAPTGDPAGRTRVTPDPAARQQLLIRLRALDEGEV